MWVKLETDHFVKYRSSWLELCDDRTDAQFEKYEQCNIGRTITTDELDNIDKNDNTEIIIHPKQYAILHLQMELCWFTLREAMEMCRKYLAIAGHSTQPLPPIGYFIASELLHEILTSINYLHQSKPEPILHRDINVNNILIKSGADGNFTKISDYGCSIEHILIKTKNSIEKIRYTAPEVYIGKYDTKADVYSIGVTVQDMFYLDINSKLELTGKYKNLFELSIKSINGMRHRRPTCADWLANKYEWSLDYAEVRHQIEDTIDLSKHYDYIGSFGNVQA